ncbi:family 20 glycosylhydrolase [Pseudoduganella eburnea]|uniref:beta-N-acetylhexosaminidase n=1 Tax=Massilia eburnea TaxID=1776165 RepID=A0A6L6QFG5_9BURK|nr:family 20 glycosylhydrolase [Massilia eburnea]MTW11112.1 family 20 glycosylhydrolase [Massilia eburnea]
MIFKSTIGLALLCMTASQAAQLQVRWDQQSNKVTMTNLEPAPLPATGWSIYFNCMECATGASQDKVAVEHVAGSLYRLRPQTGFAGLAKGQALEFGSHKSAAMTKIYKAPQGFYLVYDNMPEQAQAIGDLKILPQPDLISPQELYQRNEQADVLPATALPPIFPTPLKLQQGQGTLHLAIAPAIIAAPALKAERTLAESLLRPYWPKGAARLARSSLRLAIGQVEGQASPEAYTLEVDAKGIAITGNSAAGVANGLQSLRDLLPVRPDGRASGPVDLPILSVTDAPRFAYRGFMLDVSRNFQDKESVLRLLDLMARFKLNAFHFHLTDDEGWRLEIAGLPELTGIGAVRGHSNISGVRLQPAYGSGPSPNDKHGSGFYTRADYLEILRYAAARHIEVIPEIEMPGHARAAVQAMEARYRRLKAAGKPGAGQFLLNDLEDRSEYRSAQEYNDNVINPGLESSYTFIEHVVKQVAALHREAGAPLRTLHVGGDELPLGAWEKSPRSQSLIASRNLQGTAGLWNYFYDRVEAILRRQGLAASGWEELGTRAEMAEGKRRQAPNPHFMQRGFKVYVWNNTGNAADLGYRLANAGYDTVLAPATRFYLDMTYNKNPGEPGATWAGATDIDAIYDYVPFDHTKRSGIPAAVQERLTEDGKRHILGLEGALWTETVRTRPEMEYLLLPRLLALAERAWAPEPAWAIEADPVKAEALHRSAWSGFVNVLGQRVLPGLGQVNYRLAPPGLKQEGGKVYANHDLPGVPLHYTSDGSDPSAASPLVQGPIAERGLIKVAAIGHNGRQGWVSRIENN